MDGKLKDIPHASSSIGLGSDVRNLKEHGSASVAELREFLKTLKARNPQEVIGIVSSSLLIQSFGIACVITIALMALLTAGPYFLYGPPKAKSVAAKPAPSQSKPTAEAPPAADATAQPATQAATAPDAEKASKVMGLDEAKSTDPKKNPLDKPEIDKLLDGL
jgi:hypothetical protein